MTQLTTDPNKIRYTLILSKEGQNALKDLTERFNLSQAEIIETFLLQNNLATWEPIFTQARIDKVTQRTSKRAMLQKLSAMTPEQLAALDAMSRTGD
jgi:hypothetical protein